MAQSKLTTKDQYDLALLRRELRFEKEQREREVDEIRQVIDELTEAPVAQNPGALNVIN